MSTTRENSVSIALADVLDLHRARAKREATRLAREEELARQRAAEAARLAREQAKADAERDRLKAARVAAQQAEERAQKEREGRFQALLASRMAAIATQGERDLAALREELARRPRRSGRVWVAAVALAALFMAVAAVGCLVGTVLRDRETGEPQTAASSGPRAMSLSSHGVNDGAPRRVLPAGDPAWARDALQQREANPNRPQAVLTEVEAPGKRPWRVPMPQAAEKPATTATRCALLGPLGCLKE